MVIGMMIHLDRPDEVSGFCSFEDDAEKTRDGWFKTFGVLVRVRFRER
jgi:hypothetical protein